MLRILCFFFLLSFSGILHAQFSIKGIVTNEAGEPLDGASIFLRLSDYATISNEDGTYKLDSIPAGDYELKCSYVGYEIYTDYYSIDSDIELEIVLEGTFYNLDQVEIQANRHDTYDPFTFKNVSDEDISMDNLGQDMPFLLKNMPSTVVTSDAGAGVGYTGIRIRGTDPTRVNVTINGIPLNDSESQGVFWVNLPDFASSVSEIQVQRGVGTSTNGTGAFGATVNLNTADTRHKNYVDATLGYGSFNTRKLSVEAGTGLLNDMFSVNARFSKIQSDGYMDRASSDLTSWMLSAARIGPSSSLRLNIFSGNEKTYQSWNGVPQARVDNDQDALMNHYQINKGSIYLTEADSTNLFNSDRRYNYYTYDNQIDDYQQDHYQLHYSKTFSPKFSAKVSLFYTHGFGFFEEYRTQDDMRFYNLYPFVVGGTDTLEYADLIRRRWLDNDLYGIIINNNLKVNDKNTVEFGGSIQNYVGEHFGEVIDIILASANDKFPPYYFNIGKKLDQQFYTKFSGNLSDHLLYFLDLQVRGINYQVAGTDNKYFGDDGRRAAIDLSDNLLFFNPKLGFSYIRDQSKVYFSLARANREPDRNDYINGYIDSDGETLPIHETLYDGELGYQFNSDKWNLHSNLFYMYYQNQLVLNGALNDVGANLRTNVDESYRAGIELDGSYQLSQKLGFMANLSLSQNKIKSFDEILYDYGTDEVITNNFKNTDISFSPNIVGNFGLQYTPKEALTFMWNNQYIGKQYMDNTMNDARSLDPYFVSDFSARYSFDIPKMKKLDITAKVYNLLNQQYSANGYTYSYLFDGAMTTENFLYPQAGTYFMLNVIAGI